jgi:hypothetical protein
MVTPVLEDFADRHLQEVAWFNPGPGGPVSSPTELVCNLFDDFSFDKTSQDPTFDLTDAQRAACSRFANMVHAFVRGPRKGLTDREILDNPEWEKIRQAAANLLKILPT